MDFFDLQVKFNVTNRYNMANVYDKLYNIVNI